jgi:hypothetical protein
MMRYLPELTLVLVQTFEFREPYRMDGVQSFGEKWPSGE